MTLTTVLPDHTTLSTKERTGPTQMVIKLFDHWNLSRDDQAELLGLGSNGRRTLSRHRNGQPIGTNRDQLDRVSHLLAIHKSLRTLFPQNRELAYRWMLTRNRAFDNLTPVELIKEWGFMGLLRVRTYLDRAVDSPTACARQAD
jgi:Protein of unknown function (DUF2384)